MEIYSTTEHWAAQMLCDLLASSGIAAQVREPYSAFHQRRDYIVYLVDAADAEGAMAIVNGFRENASTDAEDPRWQWNWRCRQCGEEVEPQFTACWRCQAPRPAAAA